MTFSPKDYWTKEGGEEYFKKCPPVGSRNEEPILRVLQSDGFESLIDIGCGYGRYLKVISARFPDARLVGVDISPTQLQKAKEYLGDCKNVELREIDGIHIPYGDKSFDVSVTYGCMIHVPHSAIRAFIGEVARVSRRGLFMETNRKRTTLKDHLSPDVAWYQHNYEELFKRFHYQILWSADYNEMGMIERLFYVDFDSER